jgi:hypothetical protein
MKSRTRNIVSMLIFCAFSAVLFQGCVTTARNLAKCCNVSIEILPSLDPNVEIKKADAFQDGNELVVAGTAIKKSSTYCTYDGHIDIAVISPDGETLGVGTAEYRHHCSRRRDTSFEKRFSVATTPGTKVRMVFHASDENGLQHSAAVELLLKK